MAGNSANTFSRQALDGHDFREAELEDAVFSNCQLVGANFRAVQLRGARFENCQLFDPDAESSADFAYADVREARFS
ncbi:MAG: pentapeptide repeat-containing protein, partial [Gammaproteobacteria bacterium]|nr:pentapeptide repeat-containing protein [Gammaproteobacteria bacterium]